VIVDASAVIAALGRTDVTRRLGEEDRLSAPDLIIPETLNALWKARRAGVESAPVVRVLALLDRIRIVPSRPYAGRASDLAAALDHPVYDCLYLAMAESESDRLATFDGRFANKLKGAMRKRIVLLGP